MSAVGYVASDPNATTVSRLGTLMCASGFRLSAAASTASAVCADDGGSFVFKGCVQGPESQNQAPAPGPPRTCPDVENAAHDATYECDGQFSRISTCFRGFFKATGDGTSSDACVACSPVDHAAAASTSCILATIGSSDNNHKTVSLSGQYVCPEAVDREVWTSDIANEDTFTIFQDV